EVFNKTAAEVCIGQQLDMDYEKTQDVTINDYVEMIRLKTAVLIGTALQLGAMVAHAEKSQTELIYQYGVNLGIAFQLQDDLLDAYGDPLKIGKQPGGDILENKKTYLLLKTLELANEEDHKEIISRLHQTEYDTTKKINAIMRIYDKLKNNEYIKYEIREYTLRAYLAFDEIALRKEKKVP